MSDAVTLKVGSASLTIEPSFGGLVNSLRVPTAQGVREIIDGVAAEHLSENSGFRGVVLFPFPNRLRDGRYQFAGNEYQFAVNEASTQTALHGFLYREAAQVSRTDDSLRVSYALNGAEPGYPFRVLVVITYQLTAAGELNVSVQVANNDTVDVPVGFGWHPYFTLGQPLDDCQLQLAGVQRVDIDERMLPTAEKSLDKRFTDFTSLAGVSLDTCFEYDQQKSIASASFISERAGFGIEVWQECGPQQMNFVQLYTPPERQSFAIEPMSCSIDALNTGDGLICLKPGQMFSSAYGVRVIEP